MAKPNPSKQQLARELELTQAHRSEVNNILCCVSNQLRVRGREHDKSKLTDKELPYFAQAQELKELRYGGKKYFASLERLKPALDHHYKNNRHHPEYHENGIPDMNLVDVMEMLSDWLAASMRHGDDHSIFKSINYNRQRFKIKKDLAQIMWNTAIDVFGEEPEEGEELTLIYECLETACGYWQDSWREVCPKCGSPDGYGKREV
jgi:hypothetical protein